MIGTNTEKDFKLENYEEFYEHHHFQPLTEEDAFNAHEVIPRFGWGYDQIEQLQPKTVLDLGCLDGSFLLTVSKHIGCDVTGIDLTQDGVDIAKERAKANKLPATFYQGTIEEVGTRLADEGKKFDVITCFEVIEHVKDVQLLLEVIDELLAPGGTVLISTPAFESPIWGADDEQNKCHIRLYTMEDEDYWKVNKFGTNRKATSITKEIGKDRIKEMGIYSELINVRYE